MSLTMWGFDFRVEIDRMDRLSVDCAVEESILVVVEDVLINLIRARKYGQASMSCKRDSCHICEADELTKTRLQCSRYGLFIFVFCSFVSIISDHLLLY